ncbi:hypothetical protein AB9T88_10035, partial [Flavobacterium sp. LBUM151]
KQYFKLYRKLVIKLLKKYPEINIENNLASIISFRFQSYVKHEGGNRINAIRKRFFVMKEAKTSHKIILKKIKSKKRVQINTQNT